jgi:toxin HigB-1
MIRRYRHKGLRRFAENGSKAGIQPKHGLRLRRLLTALDVASRPEDMNAPGNDLHQLRESCRVLVGEREWQLAADVSVRG